jgi:hypothetical protein
MKNGRYHPQFMPIMRSEVTDIEDRDDVEDYNRPQIRSAIHPRLHHDARFFFHPLSSSSISVR